MKGQVFLLVSSLVILTTKTNAQYFGEKPSSHDKASIYTESKDTESLALPSAVDLTLKLPLAFNQKPRKVCWAFASTYTLVSYLQNVNKEDYFFFDTKGVPILNRIQSPELAIQLYFAGRDCDQGANTQELLQKTLNEYGHVSIEELPYSAECNLTPSDEIIKKARQHARSNYQVKEIRRDNLKELKRIIATGQPLVLSITVDENFMKIPDSVTEIHAPLWENFKHAVDDHAMTVIGYNDTIGAVKVLNSWGQAWGNNGSLWIKYTLLLDHARYYCYPIEIPVSEAELAKIKTVPDQLEESVKQTLASENSLTSWMKEGYYRELGSIRVGVSHLDAKNKFALIDIRNDSGVLLKTLYLDNRSKTEFYLEGINKWYRFTFQNIGPIGFQFWKPAVFFTLEEIKG